jgi:hypothetical protein
MLATNESSVDRIIRVLVGVVLLSLVVAGPRTMWGLIGFVPLLTGLFGFCPLYRVLGISTCARRDNHASAA